MNPVFWEFPVGCVTLALPIKVAPKIEISIGKHLAKMIGVWVLLSLLVPAEFLSPPEAYGRFSHHDGSHSDIYHVDCFD